MKIIDFGELERIFKLTSKLMVVVSLVGLLSGWAHCQTRNERVKPQQGAFSATESLLVGGAKTTFDSPSPKTLKIVESHPRIMFTASEVNRLREKLKHKLYAQSLTALTKDKSRYTGPCSQALIYALYKDPSALAFAKERLLACNIDKWGWPYYDNQWIFAWACVYDWINDGLTNAEKAKAWAAFRIKVGSKFNFVAFDGSGEFRKAFETNHNDHWGKGAAVYESVVALAINGDGVADQWATWTLEKVLDQHRSFCSPWGKHGLLDWMNLMALDSGGSQAETAHTNSAGYIGFYAGPTMLMTGAWDSATDQQLWAQMNFFRYWPRWNAYDNDTPLSPSELGLGIMEVVTGRYRQIDPEMSSLAAWYISEYGRSQRGPNIIPAIVWGDRRVRPASPEQLKMPLAKFLRGADVCISRDRWDKEGTLVAMRSRYLDTLRSEGDSGCTWIYQKHSPVLVRPRNGKWRDKATSCSGLGFRDPKIKKNRVGSNHGAAATYWERGPDRTQNAYDAANTVGYFSNCLAKEVIESEYHLFSTRFEQLYHFEGVDFAQRTLLHFPKSKLVVLIDQFEIDAGIEYYSTLRLVEEPTINDTEIVWETAAANVLAFDGTAPTWIGGINSELQTPWMKWTRARKHDPGYSSDKAKKTRMGSGAVWTYGKGANTIVTAIRLNSASAPEVKRTETGVTVNGTAIRVSQRDVSVELP